MSARTVFGMTLLAALAIDAASGVAKVMAFHHRHQGELALARADLDAAFEHLRAAHSWQPGDEPTCVLIGRVIHHSQANGLPLEALEGHQPVDTFGVGLSAVIHGIALNPGDAWAWFNLVDVYQGFRSARVRYAEMRRAGEAAASGTSLSSPQRAAAAPRGLDPEDRLSVAVTLQALDLEPDFYFYHDYLAKLYWDRGLKDEAAREIRESLTQWPRLEVHPTLENDDLQRSLADPALQGIEASASNVFVGAELAARSKAELLERVGRIDEAIAAYQALRKIGDRTLVGLSDMVVGKLEVQRGRFREALAVLGPLLDNPSDRQFDAWALYYMGEAHAGLGEHREAARLLRRHLEEMPDSLPGYLALAEEEEVAGRSGEAEHLLVAAVVKFPTDPTPYVKVIEQLRKHGKAEQALPYAKALRKVSPEREGTDDLIEQLKSEAAPRLP